MPSTLSIRRISEEDIEQYAMWVADGTASAVSLPDFQRAGHKAADKSQPRAASQANHAQTRHHRNIKGAPQTARPQVVPQTVPARQSRRLPVLVRANRVLRTVLVAMCGLAIVGYGLDVATSNDVAKMQEQARRLNEQNSELSAQLLKDISFQGIQDSVVGRFGLRTPDQVTIVKELTPPSVPGFKPQRHNLPVMSGY